VTIVGAGGAGTLEAATGWTLKPEGLCRDDVCVPIADDVRGDAVATWRRLGWPVATSGDDAYLGEPSSSRADVLRGTIAPDFTLQDLHGVAHSLSEHRGKKVFLASWAPW
jgi:hypothetical protein